MARESRIRPGGRLFDLPRLMSERGFSIARLSREANLSFSTVSLARSGQQISQRAAEQIIDVLNGPNSENLRDLEKLELKDVFVPSEEVATSIKQVNSEVEGLDALSYLLLSLTNPTSWAANENADGIRLISSKEIYLLAAIFSQFLESREAEYNTFKGSLVEKLARVFARGVKEDVAESLDNVLDSTPDLPSALLREFDFFSVGRGDERLRYEVTRVQKRLRSLQDKGLIVDPIVETVGFVAIAVVGLVPTSFTKRTEDGEVVHRKIAALLWEYESLSEAAKSEVKFHIRADEVIRGIKLAVAHANVLLNSPNRPDGG